MLCFGVRTISVRVPSFSSTRSVAAKSLVTTSLMTSSVKLCPDATMIQLLFLRRARYQVGPPVADLRQSRLLTDIKFRGLLPPIEGHRQGRTAVFSRALSGPHGCRSQTADTCLLWPTIPLAISDVNVLHGVHARLNHPIYFRETHDAQATRMKRWLGKAHNRGTAQRLERGRRR